MLVSFLSKVECEHRDVVGLSTTSLRRLPSRQICGEFDDGSRLHLRSFSQTPQCSYLQHRLLSSLTVAHAVENTQVRKLPPT